MAATRQQGTYVGTTLTGFTAFVGGLYGGGAGMVAGAIGAGLLLIPRFGFYRTKSMV